MINTNEETITITQRVLVGKDRAVDELMDLVLSSRGYFNLDDKDMLIVNKIAKFLVMPDDLITTLNHARELGYINEEEELYFS